MTAGERAVIGTSGLTAGGCAAVFLGLDTFGSGELVVKAPLVILGLFLLFRAVGLLGRHRQGPRFDAGLALSIAWTVVLIGAALMADLLPLGVHADTVATLGEAGYAHPDLLSEHPLGTNNFGLDLLARSIYGARVSLLTALVAVAGSMVVGGLVGLVAGYRRGRIDAVFGVVTDSMLAFPALIMLIALATILGPPSSAVGAIAKTGASLAIVSVPVMARLVRANTMVVAQREFVLVSRALGARQPRILFSELLPSVAVPMVSYAFILSAMLIVAEGSLAFLGLGLQQPEPTWGNMIAEADFTTLRAHPHIVLVPGTFLFLTVYSMNRIGESLQGRRLTDDVVIV